MTFDVFLLSIQQGIASGLVTGSVLLRAPRDRAVSVTIAFRTTDVANFAEGEVVHSVAYLAFFLIAIIALPYWVAVPATILAIFVGTAFFQRVVLTQVAAAKGVAVNLVIATLGLLLTHSKASCGRPASVTRRDPSRPRSRKALSRSGTHR